MKGDPKIISMLNARLESEHAGIVQYVTHESKCSNWGYSQLAEYILNRAKQEMRHAAMVMDRILFLEGEPTLINVGTVEIGSNVGEIFLLDQKREIEAIEGYTEGVDIAISCKDFATRDLMEKILIEEQSHLNDIESNIVQITNSGIANYLVAKIG